MLADERASLDLFRRAIYHHDALAWERVYQRWGGVLLHWLYQHPCVRLALAHESPDSYVTEALSKFWQATTRSNESRRSFSTLGGLLAYLRCCLNSAVLDGARQARLAHEYLAAGSTEDQVSALPEGAGGDFWRSIVQALPEPRERLLVYLRYVRGEWPREIVAAHPAEFPRVKEVYRLERAILERLRRHPALARWVGGEPD